MYTVPTTHGWQYRATGFVFGSKNYWYNAVNLCDSSWARWIDKKALRANRPNQVSSVFVCISLRLRLLKQTLALGLLTTERTTNKTLKIEPRGVGWIGFVLQPLFIYATYAFSIVNKENATKLVQANWEFVAVKIRHSCKDVRRLWTKVSWTVTINPHLLPNIND